MAPPVMSPPMRLGFQAARASALLARRARMQSRKPGAKRVDLGFDDVGAVDDGAGGDVAVGPGGVFAFGGAGGVEEAGLDEEDEGAVVEAAVEGVVLGVGDFGERSAEVHGGGAGALGCAPGDGLAEGEVELEDAGAAAEGAEAAGGRRG